MKTLRIAAAAAVLAVSAAASAATPDPVLAEVV
ncbi:MAG: hypothetical protein RLZ44_15, partial [Pseudomonadota bacterium]